MKDKRHALIFSTVWPEPNSSAAGVRQFQWIHFLLKQNFRLTLISPSKQKGETDWGSLSLPAGVECLPLPLNQSSVKEVLRSLNPDVVMFDRFILEEQFGHFVYENCPNALVLLETQDLHFVRRAREPIRENYLSAKTKFDSAKLYQTETALRETAAIERVDYSFVVSSFEEKLLRESFDLGPKKVAWIPFFYDEPIEAAQFAKPFAERNSWVWVGNFRHAPNIDGLRWFRAEVWPRIRIRLPGARLKIYGAYPSKEVMDWNSPEKTGISVLGSAPDLKTVFENARVNLAPLRFGAGIKGKILEGLRFGVPAVSTSVGTEGLLPETATEAFLFPGKEADTAQGFSEACIELYQNEQVWNEAHQNARDVMERLYSAKKIEPWLEALFSNLMEQKKEGHLPVWRSQMLRHELLNSHKYFSKWIEEKEKIKP